ncbi:MAG: hypothetical protein ACI86X_000672 [Moritella sp.]|jgi:hypothetical protein
MGGGGRTSSSNTTTNKNNSTSTAVSGDNLGVLLSGVSDSTVNVTATDHEAVKYAAELSKKALDSGVAVMSNASQLGMGSVRANENVSKHAMDANGESLRQALDFGAKALDSNDKAFAGNRSLLSAMSEQSNASARNAIALADKTIERSQIGDSGNMTKIALAVAVALSLTVVAVKGLK